MKISALVISFLLFSTTSAATELTQVEQENIGSLLLGQYIGCMIATSQLNHQWDKIKDSTSIDKISDYCVDITQVGIKRGKLLNRENDAVLTRYMTETKDGIREWLTKNNPKASRNPSKSM